MLQFKRLFATTLSLSLLVVAGCKGDGNRGGGQTDGTGGPISDAGGGIDARGKSGRTPLAAAVYGGRLDEAKRLLDQGADPAAADAKGLTPMMWAASRGHNGLLRDMVAKRPNLDAQDRRGFTAIYCAAERANAEGYKVLLDAGANPELRDRKGRSAADVLAIKTRGRTP